MKYILLLFPITAFAADAQESIPLGTLTMMFALGFLGVLGHWFKAAMNKQATWNLLDYLFMDKPGASGSMFAAYCSAYGGLYAIGAFDIVRVEYIAEAWESGVVFKPFLHALVEVVTVGYIADSGFNRSTPDVDRRASDEPK